MDLEVKIKEEPDWIEAAASTSLENCDLVSAMTHVKEETKPELTEPGPIQENCDLVSAMTHVKEETKPELTEPGPTQPVADIKDEIIIEEHTIDELVPCIKEENSVKNFAELPKGKLFCCDFCCKAFIRRKYLNAHLLVHIGERAHRCTECNSSFHRKYDLKRHMSTHSGERRHWCDVCNKTFTQRIHLIYHMITHTGNRPYPCNVCSKMFSRRYNLKRHMLTHSGQRPPQFALECPQLGSTTKDVS